MEELSEQQHCKNCSTEVDGEYCAFCGQRYHAHKESFGELVYEFTSDFLHFDSRFFKTVLPLLFLPGKLTKSYNEGKQRSQFHPIRLYLFSSFVYFFLFFTFNNVENKLDESKDNSHVNTNDSAKYSKQKDSAAVAKGLPKAAENKSVTIVPVDSKQVNKDFVALHDTTEEFKLTVSLYLDSLLSQNTTPEQYLAQQKSFTKLRRDNYFERIITIRLLKLNQQGEDSKREFFKKIIETFVHNIPKMMFFLLPVFALLLKLLYFRRKEFYYVDHAILSLHYFSFIFLMLIFCEYILDRVFGTSFFSNLAVTWILIYLLLAMKKLYSQSWRKTIVKYFALHFMFLLTVVFTLLLNMAISAIIV